LKLSYKSITLGLLCITLLLSNVYTVNSYTGSNVVNIDTDETYTQLIDIHFGKNAVYSIDLHLFDNSSTSVNYIIYFSDKYQQMINPSETSISNESNEHKSINGTLIPGDIIKTEFEITECLVDVSLLTNISLNRIENKSAQVEINLNLIDEGNTMCAPPQTGLSLHFSPVLLSIMLIGILISFIKFRK
jgi:hypothetical protein